MSAPFTPGPWSKHDCFDASGKRLTSRDIVPLGGHSLCGVAVLASVYSNEQDARLIAAAPELYDALTQIEEVIAAPQMTVGDRTAAISMACRRALAKARGEQ